MERSLQTYRKQQFTFWQRIYDIEKIQQQHYISIHRHFISSNWFFDSSIQRECDSDFTLKKTWVLRHLVSSTIAHPGIPYIGYQTFLTWNAHGRCFLWNQLTHSIANWRIAENYEDPVRARVLHALNTLKPLTVIGQCLHGYFVITLYLKTYSRYLLWSFMFFWIC